MLKKYYEFINESMDFIIESEVIYSDKFRLVLNKIDSPISKLILDIEKKDIETRSNYFDIAGSKNDTVSFIPDARAQRILGDDKEKVKFNANSGWLTYNKDEVGEFKNKKIFDDLGFTVPENAEIVKPNVDDIGEVVKKYTSTKSGKTFAYVKFPSTELVINVEKLQIVDDRAQRVWSTNRQEIKIGRVIRALLTSAKSEILDKDIEEFVNKYKSTIDRMNDKFSYFEVVNGEVIAHWYNYRNYIIRSGTIGSSCMSNVDDDYFDIYVSNPDVCSLVILKSEENESKISGRALLWKLRDGKRYMDRIYTVKDSDIQFFRDYAKENGWYYKHFNGSSASDLAVDPDGKNVNLDIVVDIKPGSYERYPYLDTLKYWSKKGVLSTSQSGSDYLLEGTDGDYVHHCEYCNGSGDRSCYECDGDGTITCYKCDGDGEITGNDGTTESCYRCDGDGNYECGECDGRGTITCYEC